MARKLDKSISDVLKKYGFGHEACWDCRGTWVVYHKVLEQIAVKAGIKLEPPVVLEADGKNKTVALCVTGHLDGNSIWSIGEASEHNYKTKPKQPAYPYAMAEKRAIDRVILKLIGLHGLAYSEEEADDFKAPVGGTRDITSGVGTQAAEMGQLDVLSPWGEVEMEFTDPHKYLAYLNEKLESVGAYFPPNEHNLIWLGQNIADEKVKKQARLTYKFGRDAWAQSPDNPDQRIVPEDPRDDPAKVMIP